MKIKKIISNFVYLFKHPLCEEVGKCNYENMDDLLDNIKYELWDEPVQIPIIRDVKETIDEIKKQKASFCRFGDGEIALLQKRSIPFQIYLPELAKKLEEILGSDDEKLFVGIVRACYYSKRNLTNVNKFFWRSEGPEFRRVMRKYINFGKTYYSAETSLACQYYKSYDFEEYFSSLRGIWANKEIVIVCGEGVFKHITNNIFDNAKTINYIFVPSQNAFQQYSKIFEDVVNTYGTSYLIICICGPTAKVLVYDLTKKGYQALDLGHIAKSYDWYKNNKNNYSEQETKKFFAPDI